MSPHYCVGALAVATVLLLQCRRAQGDFPQLHRALPSSNGKPYRGGGGGGGGGGVPRRPLKDDSDTFAGPDPRRRVKHGDPGGSIRAMDAGVRGSAGSIPEAWIYSILSAVVVGFSGVFPLLVIPLDAGPALRHGPGAARLKLLLSFAVGGLLGDVFLHLLPEAWATIGSKGEDVQWEHTKVGLLVITGLLLFMIIEKTFSSEEDLQPLGDSSDDTSSDKEHASDSESTENDGQPQSDELGDSDGGHAQVSCSQASGSGNLVTNGCATNGAIKHIANGVANGNGKCNGTANGGLRHRPGCDGKDGGGGVERSANGKPPRQKTKPAAPTGHIKVAGYLNLMANCIDNFTHGLAVAGSYLVSTKMGVCTTIAILLHEIPHEVGDFAILLRSGFDRWGAAKAQVWTAAGGLAGALAALAADSAPAFGDATAWILPFTAGGFLYIALVAVVPELLREKNPWESFKQSVCLISGILALIMVTYLFE